MIQFSKLHGAGNDFIIIEDVGLELESYCELAKKVCHRRFGVGADGLIVALKSEIADIKWHFINSDGSIGEMCGNGIRCFANYVYEKKIVNRKRFRIETLDGIKVINIQNGDKNMRQIEVNMGSFDEDVNCIPVISDKATFINETIYIETESYKISSVRMGVPHSVVLVDNLESMDVIGVGPSIEKHELFPMNTNVNFVEIVSESQLYVDTWERGAGHTMACGTGACSAVYIANRLGLVSKNVSVKTRGGDIRVEIVDDIAYMTGSAIFICDGVIYQ